jgi:hypothetical protein
MDATINQEEVQPVPSTYIESEGVRAEVLGFQTNVDGNGNYSLNFDLERTGPIIDKLVEKFLNQDDDVSVRLSEGENSIMYGDCRIDSMYGFKSFALTTTIKPVIR